MKKYLYLLCFIIVLSACKTTNDIISSKTNKQKEIKNDQKEFYKPKPSKKKFQSSPRYNL